MQVFAVTEAVAQQSSSGIGGFLPLIIIVALVFFFMSTQRRRQRAQQQTLASLAPGTLVVTTAGLYATVVEVDDGDLLLEVAPDVVCRFARGAVARVVSSPDTETPDHEGHDHDHEGHDHDHEGHHHDETVVDHPADDTEAGGRGSDEPHIDMTKNISQDESDREKPDHPDEPGDSTPGKGSGKP